MGGSPAEVWMSEDVLVDNPDYKRDILDAYAPQRVRYEAALAQFQKDEAEAKKSGVAVTKRRPSSLWRPSELYNGMIAPLLPYAIAGIGQGGVEGMVGMEALKEQIPEGDQGSKEAV